MRENPKKVAAKLQKLLVAWQTICPNKSFATMTVEQFTERVQPSLAARDQLQVLRNQATSSLTDRRQHDNASLALLNLVVNSVKGDPTEGEDGPLYRALGYIPKSARRSGLTRKSKTTSPNSPV